MFAVVFLVPSQFIKSKVNFNSLHKVLANASLCKHKVKKKKLLDPGSGPSVKSVA